MTTSPILNPYKRHRFAAEIISRCVWLYFRFCLSYRDVEELMLGRGVILTYEAVRSWCRPMALDIDRCDLTNRVNRDEVWAGGLM